MDFWTWFIICLPIVGGVIAANAGYKKKRKPNETGRKN